MNNAIRKMTEIFYLPKNNITASLRIVDIATHVGTDRHVATRVAEKRTNTVVAEENKPYPIGTIARKKFGKGIFCVEIK